MEVAAQGRRRSAADGTGGAADDEPPTTDVRGGRRRWSGGATTAGGRVRRTGAGVRGPAGRERAREFGRRQPDDPRERQAVTHRCGHRARHSPTSGVSPLPTAISGELIFVFSTDFEKEKRTFSICDRMLFKLHE